MWETLEKAGTLKKYLRVDISLRSRYSLTKLHGADKTFYNYKTYN